jgi:hypothetical protein
MIRCIPRTWRTSAVERMASQSSLANLTVGSCGVNSKPIITRRVSRRRRCPALHALLLRLKSEIKRRRRSITQLKLPQLPAFIRGEIPINIRKNALVITSSVGSTSQAGVIFILWSHGACWSSRWFPCVSCNLEIESRCGTTLNARTPIVELFPTRFGARRNRA